MLRSLFWRHPLFYLKLYRLASHDKGLSDQIKQDRRPGILRDVARYGRAGLIAGAAILLLAPPIPAQVVVINSSDNGAVSLGKINSNFALLAPKANPVFTGSFTFTGLGSGALKSASGVLGLVSGTSTFCVHVDGSSAACTTGAVVSVGMTGDNVIYNSSVTGSPVTNSGTLVPTLKTQTANFVFAGPTTGSAATPSFRAMVAADLPAGVPTSAPTHAFVCNIGSATGSTVILTGDTGCYSDGGSFTGAINRADIIGNAASLATCSITVDLWLASGAYPTSSNKISASAPATLSGAKSNYNFTRTGWSNTVSANPMWGASVASVTGCVYAQIRVEFQ